MRVMLLILFIAAALLLQPVSEARRQSPSSGLKALAEQRGFYVGAAIAMSPFKEESDYLQTLQREFNICVAENTFKFDSIHPSEKSYSFDDADAIARFAEENAMKLRGHTLVWHRQLPKWLTEGRFNRTEAIAILKDHIETLVKRYKGKVWVWDVVNEAVSEDGKSLRKDSFWFQKIGPDYIKLAFQFACDADPDAILYYNDFSAEDTGTKSDTVYKLLRDLKKQGVRVDGVGWQMHLDTNFRVKPEHGENARRLAEMGLAISITELDVRVSTPPSPDELNKQAAIYRDVSNFCLTAPNCQALVMWGFTDKYSWIPENNPGSGDALIFDERYQPKPSYRSLKEAIVSAVTTYPKITDATVKDNNLEVNGENFGKGSVVILNWKRQKTAGNNQSPVTRLTIKRAARDVTAGLKLILQVQNADGKLSPEFSYTMQ